MSLKSAALLAMIASILLTVLQVWRLIANILAVTRGLIPEVVLVSSLIYAFAAIAMTVFFCVFHRAQR